MAAVRPGHSSVSSMRRGGQVAGEEVADALLLKASFQRGRQPGGTTHRRNQHLSREVVELRNQLAAAHSDLRDARRQPHTPIVLDRPMGEIAGPYADSDGRSFALLPGSPPSSCRTMLRRCGSLPNTGISTSSSYPATPSTRSSSTTSTRVAAITERGIEPVNREPSCRWALRDSCSGLDMRTSGIRRRAPLGRSADHGHSDAGAGTRDTL
ncbi:MAG: hypothetical protein QOG10_6728 [Kribbellaceae bacterium]|nr:hypothetical protein [Kribbellaceae bacterium]